MEVAVVKVRPSYNDKKLHVLRFLFPEDMYDSDCIYQKLGELFPNGFFSPKIERFMIDYSINTSLNVVSLCDHDYLAKYLNSEKKYHESPH